MSDALNFVVNTVLCYYRATKALKKYVQPKLKRYARQKCCLFPVFATKFNASDLS